MYSPIPTLVLIRDASRVGMYSLYSCLAAMPTRGFWHCHPYLFGRLLCTNKCLCLPLGRWCQQLQGVVAMCCYAGVRDCVYLCLDEGQGLDYPNIRNHPGPCTHGHMTATCIHQPFRLCALVTSDCVHWSLIAPGLQLVTLTGH